MSVYLNPSSSLGFTRPLTVLVKRTLTITNPHNQPVAFKVKTTAPKLYCVRPNSGRVEPGQSAEVAVMLQPMKEEPPLNAKCKDKFLIQSTIITPEKDQKPLAEMWSGAEATGGPDAVHQQKLKVVYLPPEGQTLEEEDENAANQSFDPAANQSQELPANQSSFIGDSQFATTRPKQSGINGHHAIPDFSRSSIHDNAGPSHHEDFSAAHEEPQHPPPVSVFVQPPPVEPPADTPAHIQVQPPPPPPPAPRSAPEPVPIPAPLPPPPAPAPAITAELEADLKEARAEIERLRSLLAAAAPPTTELRKRSRRLSDDMSTVPGSDVGTMIDEPLSQEGVPLQVVVVISLLVFITTYLFF
ncbi:phosphatidylinositol-binding protein scs2 [Marasmius tenuissimus]|uniref:Phosphatidylinositol-binding protein scs2 n=1 Tax=Marasmius tenuissimus TaxID=585030 RepID=A0ABR3A8W0_9AGAR|nr:phosphatidylinositol-binding protein scs2 [Marasmius tenuissimus]